MVPYRSEGNYMPREAVSERTSVVRSEILTHAIAPMRGPFEV